MGRPAKFRISKDHPSPRFRGKVRLSTQVHGADDTRWYAQYNLNGKWQPPYNPVSLKTSDYDEACEIARDRYAAIIEGAAITKPRKPAIPTDTFGIFAQQAIVELEQQEAKAILIDKRKGQTFKVNRLRIVKLVDKFGAIPIADIDEDMLNDWVKHEYRVRVRKKGLPDTFAMASQKTLGNMDWCFSQVYEKAVDAKVVDRRKRPVIDLSQGEEGESRAFIDHAGVQALKDLMTDDWVNATSVDADHRRLLRVYIALACSTGIRAGMELDRTPISAVKILQDRMLIWVQKRQGKHYKGRNVVVFEGGIFPIRQLLTDLVIWRRKQGAVDADRLFAFSDGVMPSFAKGLTTALKAANALIDPDTNENRVGYSFRHYFATLQIERGLSVVQLCDWMGCTPRMIDLHYNKYLSERQANLINGYDPANRYFSDEEKRRIREEILRSENDPDDSIRDLME